MESKSERFSQNLEEKDKDVETVKEKMIGIEEGKWRDGIQLGENCSKDQR